MTRYVWIMLMVFALCISAYAQESGDGAYQQGDYVTAIRLYEAQIASGNTDIAVWVNLGNAYWMNGENAQALRYLLRAQQALPREESLATTIALIRADNNTSSTQDTDFWRTLGTLTNPFITFQELSIFVWGLWLAVIIVTSLYALLPAQRNTLRWLWGLIVVILGVSGGLLASRYIVTSTQPLAIVLNNSTAYSGADNTYLPLFTLNSATEVRLLSEKDSWGQVVLSDGQLGWVPLTDMTLVNPSN
jgi:tetratricopeptide (TPR) repeat protein